MRSIWNGSIAFGLVSIPVKLMSATENHSVSFRQIHTEDGGRVRYRKVCELEDEEVQAADTVRGYEMADGTVVTVTDEDLAALPLRTTKTIEVVAVLPADRIDPLQMDTAYYLAANGTDAGKPYVLLREALKRTGSIALTKFALRGRERLAMLRVVDDVLLLHSLLWPDEIRSTEHVAPEGRVTIKDAELDLADALMDTLGEIDPDTMHDDYRAALDELIAAKLSGELPRVRPRRRPRARRSSTSRRSWSSRSARRRRSPASGRDAPGQRRRRPPRRRPRARSPCRGRRPRPARLRPRRRPRRPPRASAPARRPGTARRPWPVRTRSGAVPGQPRAAYVTKPVQAVAVTANCGPALTLLSRTWTVPGQVAISTQSSPESPLWLDLCQVSAISTQESPSPPL